MGVGIATHKHTETIIRGEKDTFRDCPEHSFLTNREPGHGRKPPSGYVWHPLGISLMNSAYPQALDITLGVPCIRTRGATARIIKKQNVDRLIMKHCYHVPLGAEEGRGRSTQGPPSGGR